MQTTASATSWLPPHMGIIKVNFDVEVSMKRRKGFITALARNHRGIPLTWLCWSISYITDPLMLECLACREAIMLVRSHGYHSIEVEGDTLVVIQSISKNNIPSSISVLIKDIHSLSSVFRSISFLYVRHNENQVAHSLTTRTLHDTNFLHNLVVQSDFC